MRAPSPDPRPLIVHVVHGFAVGGLENGVVNLLNRLPADRWRHAVLALTSIDDTFIKRVRRDDVVQIELRKPSGYLYGLFPKLVGLLRGLKPAIVHTRNLAALEVQVPAWLARVPVRIHGEHGWGANDPGGVRNRYQLLRAAHRPFVHHYIALSKELESYLTERVGVPATRVSHICNGVDAVRFQPTGNIRPRIEGSPFIDPSLWLVGTVGRMESVKDQTSLVRAFASALQLDAEARRRMRLVLVGDGPLRPEVERVIDETGVRSLVWVAGERHDIPEVLRGFDLFVLPSLAEGISNTILEAMSSGLPVVATKVGGNPELLEPGLTGALVPSADPEALARAMLHYFRDPHAARRHGSAGRSRVERQYSLDRMVADYDRLYRRLLERRGVTTPSLRQA